MEWVRSLDILSGALRAVEQFNILQLIGNPPKPALASTLPFDVLYIIFEYSLSQETVEHPVETLLLVCKSWHTAASVHPRLWSNFKILSPCFEFWYSCIPRRLRRCHSDTLLDISIELVYRPYFRRNSEITYIMYEKVLRILVGPSGEVAKRWRRFSAVDNDEQDGGFYTRSAPTRLLSFPTPNLRFLFLLNVTTTWQIFPETPALKEFYGLNVFIPSFPDFSAAQMVYTSMDGDFEKAVDKAGNLKTLILGRGRVSTYGLSKYYPYLTSMTLITGLRPGGFMGFSAPALRELSLEFGLGTEFLTLSSCHGISFNELQRVTIREGSSLRDPGIKAYLEGLHEFLRGTKNIELLQLHGTVTSTLGVKLLQSDLGLFPGRRHLILKVGHLKVELGQGESRITSLREIRDSGEVTDGTWEEIFAKLK